jgi:carbon-monoxide dehydrogenase medium subunit
MKPPEFDYESPETVAEAVELLSASSIEAKVLAGGQSLVPLLNLRLAYPDLLVDLRRIEGLRGIEASDDLVRIGAMTRQRELEFDKEAAERCPLLAIALAEVAHPQIRSRGTVGGSIAHGDPAAELPAVLVALDGSVSVQGPDGSRDISAADFYKGMLTTDLAANEILTSVEFPAAPLGAGAACVELARRAGDYAMSGAVAQVTVDSGQFATVRLALFGVSDLPVRERAIEQALIGEEATAERIVEAIEEVGVAREVSFPREGRMPEEYARHLAAVVAKRAIAKSLERAS